MNGSQNLDEGYDSLRQIDFHHVPYIFPWCADGACGRSVTISSHADADTWSDWTVITDSLSNKFSDLFTSKGGYLSAIITESVSKKDNFFQFEVAYGTSKSIISRFRALAGDTKISSDSGKNLRNPKIPSGQELYYRCASESGGESITVQIRYYFEDGV